MLHDIASSLHHLHSRRLIHRDLKPGNLLVTSGPDRDVVKLADFGLARNYLKNSTMTVGIGTWQYSSPEFFTNSKLTAKSDVYSFGVVLWEMCTRTQPYRNRDFREVMEMSLFGTESGLQVYECVVRNKDYSLPPPASMDPVLESIYVSCINKDPENRPEFADIITILEA